MKATRLPSGDQSGKPLATFELFELKVNRDALPRRRSCNLISIDPVESSGSTKTRLPSGEMNIGQRIKRLSDELGLGLPVSRVPWEYASALICFLERLGPVLRRNDF